MLEFRHAEMNPDLAGLIRLQRADSELRRVEAELAQIPRRRSDIQASLAAERARLDGARSSLDASQKARRKLEGELQDLEAKRSKYKGQLMDAKTNKEYTAMLHEIEGVEREIRAREDLVLAEMEKAEVLAAEVKREEQEFKTADDQTKAGMREMDEEERRLGAEAERLAAERDAVAAEVPVAMLELFQRVARVRGTAVSEATKDAMCSQCHVKLRPQMFVDLKRGDQFFQCPQCNRILYYEAPVPVVVPQP